MRKGTTSSTAEVTGGTSPYTYHWYRDGAYVGTGASYTASAGTRDFILRAEATDATMATRAAIFPVRVDGIVATISGPYVVYLSEGGGTWTASAQGGTPPYSYGWYLDGDFVDTGSSYAGYPGEGTHVLRVDATDAAGKAHSDHFSVKGIGADGGCDPTLGRC